MSGRRMENSKRIEAPDELSARRIDDYCSAGHCRSPGASLNDVTKWGVRRPLLPPPSAPQRDGLHGSLGYLASPQSIHS